MFIKEYSLRDSSLPKWIKLVFIYCHAQFKWRVSYQFLYFSTEWKLSYRKRGELNIILLPYSNDFQITSAWYFEYLQLMN